MLTAEQDWQDGLAELAVKAQRDGELAEDVDARQLAFELQACLELTNYHFVLFRDQRVISRGRRAVAAIINRTRSYYAT